MRSGFSSCGYSGRRSESCCSSSTKLRSMANADRASEGHHEPLDSEETFSEIMSSTVVGQTPRSYGMHDLRQSAIKGVSALRSESTSSALSTEGRDVVATIMNISPGTGATPSKMRTRIENLQSAKKGTPGSTLRSVKRIDLEATAAAFLESDTLVGEEENVYRPLASSQGNATFVVRRLALRPIDVGCNTAQDDRTFAVPTLPPAKNDLEGPAVIVSAPSEDLEKQQRTALTAWLNHILKANLISDAVTENAEMYIRKSKKEADRHLREILAAVKWTTGATGRATTVSVPTKEQFSQRLYGEERKLNELRIRARHLFEQSPVPNEIARIVKEDKIQVRPDREVYADVGIKVELLLMLLKFHPLWLRLGLETVFGEVIPLHPESFTVGLTTFIAQRLFTDPLLLQKRHVAHQTVKTVVSKDGGVVLLRHFLTKLCQFLFFVETANQSKLIPQNPCLFLRNSPIKSTEEVLSMISRELISGSGNLPKMLTRVGYKATYKQGFFEEYHFVVHRLTDGLQDGIILAKIVELLTNQPDKIMTQLRNPMNDRLRKVSNVETVLTSARSAGIDMGEIKAEHIVAGHKEETLELVWRLVGAYMVAQTESGAMGGRRASLAVESWSTRRLSHIPTPTDLEQERVVRNIVLLQSLVRGFLARKRLVVLKTNRVAHEQRRLQAAIRIQCFVRLCLAKKQLAKLKTYRVEAEQRAIRVQLAVVYLQSAARGMLARRQLHRLRIAKQEADRLAEHQRRLRAAIQIQCFIRCCLAKKVLAKLKVERVEAEQRAIRVQQAVVYLQSAARGMLARRQLQCLRIAKEEAEHLAEAQRRLRATIRLQCFVRRCLAEKVLAKLKAVRLDADQRAIRFQRAVVAVQTAVRGMLARRELQRLRIAKQEADRLADAQRRLREQRALQIKAVITIQCAARGMLARRELQRLKIGKEESDRIAEEQRRLRAVIKLQCYIRGLLAKKRLSALRAERLEAEQRAIRVQQAVIALQRAARGMLARLELQRLRIVKQEADRLAEQQRRLRATICLQCFIRCCLAKKVLAKLKAERVEAEQRAIRVQQAIVYLQSAVRGMLARRELQRLRIAKREADRLAEAQRRLRAIIRLQCFIRCCLAKKVLAKLKADRLEAEWRALQLNQAAVVLQSAVRSWCARRELRRLKTAKQEADRLAEEKRRLRAAIVIQSAVRGMKARRELSRLKMVKRESERLAEEKCRQNAAIRIQSFIRQFLAKKRLVQLKSERIVAEQREALRLRHAILVQAYSRRFLAKRRLVRLKSERDEAEQMKKAVIVIQSAARGMFARRELQRLRAAKKESDRIAEERRRLQAIVCIQSAVRGMLARRELQRLRIAKKESDRIAEEQRRLRAVIQLQSYMRRFLAKKQLSVLRAKRFEAVQRAIQVQQAVIALQSVARGVLARRELQRLRIAKREADRLAEQQRRLRAAIQIQCFIRCCLARKQLAKLKVEDELRAIRVQQAVIVLQTAARGMLARRELQRMRIAKQEADRLAEHQRRLRATICLQCFIRCCLAKKVLAKLKAERVEAEQRAIRIQHAVIALQSAVRGMLARRELQRLRIAKRETDRLAEAQRRLRAIIRLQCFIRCCLAKKVLAKLKADRLEAEWRALQLNQAAVVLQSAVRSWCARRELRRLKTAKLEADRLAEEQRRLRAAVLIQARLRGVWSRRKFSVEVETVKERMTEWQLGVETEEVRTRTIMDRVRDRLPDLLHESLYRRKKAAFFLERATHWSSKCCLYVVENNGVAIVFDCLDELNRGEGCVEVILFLMPLLITLTKCRLIAHEMIAEQDVLLERGLHYWLAFHNKPEISVMCARMLINVTKLTDVRQKFVQFKGPWYLDQMKRKFARLPSSDPRVVVMAELVKCVQKE